MATMKKASLGTRPRGSALSASGSAAPLGDVTINLDAQTSLRLTIGVEPAASGVRIVPPTKGPKRADFGVCYDLGPSGRLRIACSIRSERELKKALAQLGLDLPLEVSGPIVIKRAP